MMNRYFYPQKFYDRQWWMTFRELNELTYANPNNYTYDILGTLYGFLCSIKWIPYGESTSEVGRTATYRPIFVLKETEFHVKYWDDNDFVSDLWRLLKERYCSEYIIGLSFQLPVINDSIWDNYAYYGMSDEQMKELTNKAFDFLQKLMVILKMTYDRYSNLLTIYKNERDNLLNKVEAITRFNDTPQDTGEFSDDEHTTHITTSKNDYDTLMGRIAEIDRAYRNLLKDWTEEFSGLFIHEEGL